MDMKKIMMDGDNMMMVMERLVNLPDATCMEMEKPMMAVPRYRLSTTHPAVVANNRELRRHLGKRKVFCERHVGAPQVGRHHHHAWAEPGGEEDAREAASKETHTEGGREGGRLEEDFVFVFFNLTQTTQWRRVGWFCYYLATTCWGVRLCGPQRPNVKLWL